MKKETVYSLLLATVCLGFLYMSRFVEYLYRVLDKELDGLPYPPLTQFMKDTLSIWSVFFIIVFLIIAIISLKKEKLCYHLIFATVITEIIFLSVLVVSCILPLMPQVGLNSSSNPLKSTLEEKGR